MSKRPRLMTDCWCIACEKKCGHFSVTGAARQYFLEHNGGLKAEDGLAPLVVSSCIAGILFFVIVLGSSFVCFISWRKRSKKVSQTTSNPRVSSFVNTDSPPPQAKAYTHHALLVRQRPPLQFYTVRSDPRDQGLAAGAVPMGPFRRPTSMGRPVLYLDMLDPAMNENNAMPHYANAAYGGMNISEMQSVDERGRLKTTTDESTGSPKGGPDQGHVLALSQNHVIVPDPATTADLR
ncbi:hypothetical protein C0Q70_01336 [Pomacea canaliculata]|uniref:Uncharacterized protein n=1 Tax=Pomacea canaliculata TaxID=400727 RepID=A0A2T7PZ57_POMCA|nr:hypothetical protein C0Q70_01336 [Pomacea canaliculata]